MIVFEPKQDYVILERAMSMGSKIALPDSSEACSDDVFVVMSIGPGSDENPQTLSQGDMVCLVGYISTFTYKGEKVILGRARDVIAVVKDTK